MQALSLSNTTQDGHLAFGKFFRPFSGAAETVARNFAGVEKDSESIDASLDANVSVALQLVRRDWCAQMLGFGSSFGPWYLNLVLH